MTTGYVQTGGDGTKSLYIRQWSGSDGQTIAGSTKKKWNPYTLRLDIMSADGGGPNKDRFLQNMFSYYNSGDWTANDELRALSDLSSNIRTHSFNLNVAAAEAKQTTFLVVNTLSKLTQALKSVRQGRIDQALRHLGAASPRKHIMPVSRGSRQLTEKDVSAMWLEIAYGWTPLLKDVYEAMAAYSAITNDSRTFTVIGRAKRKDRQQFTYNDSVQIRQRRVIKRQIIVELEELMSVPRSLGLTDPLSVVWELTPLSFVADWFIPIGRYLELLSMIPQLKGRWCTTTTTIVESEMKPVSSGFWSTYFAGAKATSKRITVARTLPASVPVPTPEFKPLNQALNLPHVLNGIALLHQLSTVWTNVDLTKWKFR